MAPKRALGLGKSAKAKKKQQLFSVEGGSDSSKTVSPAPSSSKDEKISSSPDLENQQLTVELDESVDSDDEIAQLKGLWKTYVNSNKDNELMLNGIIHECDRLLRNSSENETKLTDEFHSIYALSLSELAKFNTALREEDEEVVESKVGEYFDAAIERVTLGLDAFPNSNLLKLSESQININRIPLEYISSMDLNSTRKQYPNLHELINKSLQNVESLATVDQMEFEILEFLKSFDDLIDIISYFGRDNMEGLDSEDEEEFEEVEISKKHPLYKIQREIPVFNDWRRGQLIKLQELNKNEKISKELCSLLGKSYLQELELPEHIYTTLRYDEENDASEIEGLNVETSRQQALKFFLKLIPLLERLLDDSKPESIVDLAQLEISMGNLYEVGSEEQESYYGKAEVKLRKLNNITHGKYQDILDTIINK